MHKVFLTGKCIADAEMRYTPGGTAVSNVRVADEKYKSKSSTPDCPEGWRESYNEKGWTLSTIWRVTLWGKFAEAMSPLLVRGQYVTCSGEVQGEASEGHNNPRVWVDKNDSPRANFELTARELELVGFAPRDREEPVEESEPENEPMPSSEIPF